MRGRFARGLGVALAVFLIMVPVGKAQTPPAASSGSGKIAFVSDRDGSEQIYVMGPDGSNVTRLTNPPGTSFAPAFSPDGRKIAFTSDRDGSAQTYIMDVDGSHVTRLTNPPGNSTFPTFSP